MHQTPSGWWFSRENGHSKLLVNAQHQPAEDEQENNENPTMDPYVEDDPHG